MEKDLLNRLQRANGDPTHHDPYSHPLLAGYDADKEISERKRLKR
jgi:hypothetical protein